MAALNFSHFFVLIFSVFQLLPTPTYNIHDTSNCFADDDDDGGVDDEQAYDVDNDGFHSRDGRSINCHDLSALHF